MSFDDAIRALSEDALKYVKDNSVVGLGSGRAATAFVKELAKLVQQNNYNIRCIPTSLQIKITAEEGGLEIIEADQTDQIDVIFDGADQIDSQKHLIKGGGGALLRENILINMSKRAIIMADETKFADFLSQKVPVEIHPLARTSFLKIIREMGSNPLVRTLERGYPVFTENGNIIIDCNFGIIKNPTDLSRKLKQTAGVMEVGLFTKIPDIVYKAKKGGKFDIIN